MRRNRDSLWNDLDSSPNTSWYFLRNPDTFKRRSSSIAASTAEAMFGLLSLAVNYSHMYVLFEGESNPRTAGNDGCSSVSPGPYSLHFSDAKARSPNAFLQSLNGREITRFP